MPPLGERLGNYHIVSELGAGGMGEVYLAEDIRLRRKVALKVLPRATAADERAQKRLIREAQAAATLDHPNICTVYEVGEADGQTFIAMQYVDGETLAARLKRGPLNASDALAIATQVTAALAEAHRHGIVHLDVKPQNIMLTAGSQVKVLDFGLAKLTALEHDGRTATLVTEVGAISGTVPYMSPEQIRGEALDRRSDVFSLGCVLYEMIGGVSPFLRGHAADTMAAILTEEPPALPDGTIPADLRRAIGKCLEKDRQRRYQTIEELAIDLETARNEIASAVSRAPAVSSIRPRARASRAVSRAIVAAIVVLLVAAAAAAAYFYLRPGIPVRLSSDDFVQITGLPDAASAPAISPDGRMVAFIRGEAFLGTGQVYVKLLPNGDPVQLTNDPRPKYGPTFTPDGSRIAYTLIDEGGTPSTSWDTWTVPVLGGQPSRMLRNAAGLTWIDDDHVLFSEIEQGTGLHMGVVTATQDRQDERRIYFPAQDRAMAHYSHLSPDRRWVLVVEMDRTATFQPCRVVPFDGSSPGRTVGPKGVCMAAAWSADGRWMYFSASVNGASHLWRQRFPDGMPAQLTSSPTTEERGVVIDREGRFLVTSIGQAVSSLWLHDAGGDRMMSLDGSVTTPRMSRDGTRVYCLVQRVGDGSARGLTQVDLSSGKADRVLTEFSLLDFDISRDEQFAAFTASGEGGTHQIWLAALDRRSPPRRLASEGDRVRFGRSGELVYRSLTGTTNGLVRITTDGRDPVRIFDGSVIEFGDVSPDGEWAVVETPSSDGRQAPGTLVVPVHGGSARLVCSGNCGIRWSPDGKAAYVQVRDGSGVPRPVNYPLRPGEIFPDLSTGGLAALHGSPELPWDSVAVGPDPSVYVFTKVEQRGNLFRVPLP